MIPKLPCGGLTSHSVISPNFPCNEWDLEASHQHGKKSGNNEF